MCTQQLLMNVCWYLQGGCIRSLDAWPWGLGWLAVRQCANLNLWTLWFCCFVCTAGIWLLHVTVTEAWKNKKGDWRWGVGQFSWTGISWLCFPSQNKPMCLLYFLPPVERRNCINIWNRFLDVQMELLPDLIQYQFKYRLQIPHMDPI